MSPTVANSLVHDLVEMAKAMEMLPQVQAELADARKAMNEYLTTIQRLELKLLDRSNEITDLERRLQDAEVSRDDAELRFLEADDKLSRVIGVVKGSIESLGVVVPRPIALEPVRPAETEGQGQSEVPSSPDTATSQAENADTSHVSPMISASSTIPAPNPASEVAPAGEHDANTESLKVTSVATATTTGDGDASSPQSGNEPARFVGARYSEVIRSGLYPSRDEWEAGGGSVDGWYS